MHCRHCQQPVDFAALHHENLKRFRQFLILALVLALIGGSLHWAGVAMWPYWLYGMAGFVLSQALFRWQQSRWVICGHCKRGYSHYF
ncbi:hypothetical protein [Chitiniphilus shinanonensis]|uniref:hypothetical protein n=1 Tax=Chitiniphilus shinanonensis TaxID=553088 RepID=UPI003068DAD9